MKIEPNTPDSNTEPNPTGPSGVSAGVQPSRPRGRVFDVMRPGKAPASPTSRPVIAGHKSSAQATQVHVSGIGANGGGASMFDSHKKVEIQPVDGTVSGDTSPVAAPAPTVKTPEATTSEIPEIPMPSSVAAELIPASSKEAVDAPNSKKSKDPLEEPEKPIDPAKLDDAALDPEPPEPAPAEPEKDVPPTPVETAHDPIHEAAAPNLEGQVVVSHHTTAPKGTGRLVALIALMVLFACLLVDILLDAGVLSSSVIPHTNFF